MKIIVVQGWYVARLDPADLQFWAFLLLVICRSCQPFNMLIETPYILIVQDTFSPVL